MKPFSLPILIFVLASSFCLVCRTECEFTGEDSGKDVSSQPELSDFKQIEKVMEHENNLFIDGLDTQLAKLKEIEEKEKELSIQSLPKESESKPGIQVQPTFQQLGDMEEYVQAKRLLESKKASIREETAELIAGRNQLIQKEMQGLQELMNQEVKMEANLGQKMEEVVQQVLKEEPKLIESMENLPSSATPPKQAAEEAVVSQAIPIPAVKLIASPPPAPAHVFVPPPPPPAPKNKLLGFPVFSRRNFNEKKGKKKPKKILHSIRVNRVAPRRGAIPPPAPKNLPKPLIKQKGGRP